jgi:hypothetical protein
MCGRPIRPRFRCHAAIILTLGSITFGLWIENHGNAGALDFHTSNNLDSWKALLWFFCFYSCKGIYIALGNLFSSLLSVVCDFGSADL